MDGEMIPLSLDEAMALALQEAIKGAPFVSPNPKVGCVILSSSGRLLSKGYHQIYGGPHAEIEALKGLHENDLVGAHVVVTLEPCAHEGKTPSCAKKLATLPISKVTYGLQDPNPLVSGEGAKILRKAGIQVELYKGNLERELEETCEEFLVNFREKRIFVAMKVAQSLDGKVALKNGKSQWITNEASRKFVQTLRAQYDAVLVGKRTLIHDNPRLDIRDPKIHKTNQVVVLGQMDSFGPELESFNIFKVRNRDQVFFETGDLKKVLERLYQKGLRSLLIEGGGATFSTFLEQGLVDRLHVLTAPLIMGAGLGWSEGLRFEEMENILKGQNPKVQTFGQDQYISFRLPTRY